MLRRDKDGLIRYKPAKPYCMRPRRRGWKHHREIIPYNG